MDEEKLSFGEKVLEVKPATPEQLNTVGDVKALYAEIIDLLNAIPTEADPSERNRLVKIAIQEAEGASMWATKAITWTAK